MGGKLVCKPYCKVKLCNVDNSSEFISRLAVATQLVMHRCNLVISGSLKPKE